MPRILVTAPTLDPAGQRLLDAAGYETYHAKAGETLERIVADWAPHGIISRTRLIPETVIAAASGLRAIAKHGAGVDNIDVVAATSRGIPVFSTPGANSLAVAEFTVALIFAAARHVARFDRAVRAGGWDRPGDGRQLSGMTLALVGYGRVARRVARIAGCIGMRVTAHDPFADRRAAARRAGVELRESLDELLRDAEVLSLHCPAERGAPPLIDAARLAALPRGAFLVNTARGELVDEIALVEALESGHLAGAGLDTFAVEPLPASSRLRELPNVVLSPHVGGSTPEALAAMASGAASTLIAYLNALGSDGPVPDELWARCINAGEVRDRTGTNAATIDATAAGNLTS